ncbi:MAG: DUF111 family protein, partial [Clostridia bacterium]|nr:DUF111 family protein [Clostridia bacterium]
LGETEDKTDEVAELSCQIDDMTAEEIAFAAEQIRDSGARDVYTVSAAMKKNRSGAFICVICDAETKNNVIQSIFRHTTTLGIRESRMKRYILERQTENVQTKYGTVRRKCSTGYGVNRSKYEYEDVARIAREQGVSFREALALIDEKQESH